MRLLLVEDDRIYQTFLGGLLQTEAERVGVPLSIEVANSLEEARAATMAHDVDAALLDLNLPDSSRLRTLQDLLNFKPDLPVVVLSAEEDEGLAFDSVTSGAQDYIVKGDEDPRQILRSLQHSIERKRIQEELRRANARYHRDLKAATLVQQSLLPSEPPEGGDLEWAWSFTPASELAGDIYNCFDIDEDTVGCYLVDVSGHGVSAALLAVQVSRVLTPEVLHRHLPRGGVRKPAAVLEHLNGWFDTIVSTGQFFTASYVVFNHRTGRLWVASAGHPPPMLVGSDGSVRELSTSGIPIGVQPGYSFRQQEVAFQAGDRLYLYSDGLIEAVQGDRRQQEQVDQGDTARFFGRQRLADLLGSLSSLGLDAGLGQVRNSIAQWSAPFEADDDRTIIAFGRRT